VHPRHVLAGLVALLGVTLSCSSATEPKATVSPSLSTITTAAASLVADGASQTVVTVTLKDTDGAAYGKSGGLLILATTSGTLGAVTDLSNGNYSATLTSSRTAGPAVVSANVGGTALTATATVNFVAGPVAAIGVASPTSNNQSAVVGTTVANPPSVKVTDANGNGVAGEPVTFSVSSGGGSVTGAAQTTDANGVATVGSWKLGSVAGTNTLVATTTSAAAVAEGSESAADRTVIFTATGTAGMPGSIALNGGDGQTAVAGSAVTTAPSVKVVDGNNNPVNGATVNFSVASGGGSITGAVATTNSSGVATVGSWTLGTTAGGNSITASTPGVSGLVTISATGVAGPAASIAIANPVSNGQTAAAGSPVTVPPAVKVTDSNGNPVSGVSVTFAVGSGGGSVTGETAVTNSSGIAAVGSWTLGPTAGANSLTAASGSLSGSPVTFTATGTAGAAGALTIVGGNNQTATAGTNVTTAPSVKVTDINGNAVAGATVTFSVLSGGGSVTGAAAVSNASGVATVGSWKLGDTAGANTLAATSGSLAGVVFTATGTAGAAASIALNAGNNQSATAGTSLGTPPSVIVTDAHGNPVANAPVTFAVATGGGSVTGASATTDASGIATVGGWTLGPVPGANSLTASSTGLTGSPVLFNATGIAGRPASINIAGGNGQSATVGTNIATAPTVRVTGANGELLAGVTVTFSVATGGGSITGASALTDASGIAAVGSWTLGLTAGTNTMSATTGDLAPVTFTATGTAGPAASIAVNAGNNQSAVVGTPVAILPSVKITDANGNAVAGTSVTFAVASGGGSVSGASATSDANGIATVGSWTLGPSAGPNTLTATSSGLAGSPVTFTATGSSGPPANIVKIDGDGQTANAGSNVAVAPSVKVTASNGDPLSGIAVVFAVATGGGSVTGGTATTNSNGIATPGSWKLGNVAGSNTLTATAGSLAPVTFTATGSVGAAALIVINAGNNQTASTGSAVTVAPSVKVTDAVGNAVSGAGVTFAVASGGGSITGATPSTNASGIAAVGSWTLGGTAGPNTLTASLNGVAGASVTFNATAQAIPPLIVDVAGTLERGETITVTVTQNGSPLPPSGYTLTVTPSDGATVNGDGTIKLLKAGSLTLNASASGGSTGTKSITVATPPSVVFDLLNNGNRDIWRVALDGGDLQQLTTDPADDQHPSAATGKLVYSSAREGNLHVYVQPLAGGSATRVTPVSNNPETEPRISRDGQRVAYISNTTGLGRATYANIDGSNPLPVDNTSGNPGAIEFSPDWSPASDKIVFGSTAAGAADVYFANTLGAVASYFAGNSTSKADLQPVYSPDGTRIAFISNRAGSTTDLYTANIDGTNIQKVASNASGPAWVRSDRLVFETVIFTSGQPLRGTLHWIDPSNPSVVHDIDTGSGDARNASPIY
jgi:adhesin/invasin